MRILLFGEFSGFHWALKEGLLELGHEVQLASTGDGWKKIPGADIHFGSRYAANWFNLAKNWRKLRGYDIVQFMSPVLFNARPSAKLTRFILSAIRDGSDKSFLAVAGGTSIKWKAINEFRYHPYEEYRKHDLNGGKFWWENPEFAAWDTEFSHSLDGIIPVTCEYQFGYGQLNNLRPLIPLPVNLSRIEYLENKLNGKLVVFHGVSRYGFKGTRHVEAAFQELNRKYPNDIECIIQQSMPFTEYLALMRKVNVVVDQTYSYSAGMNALFGMAMGKVVMGGAELESLTALGVETSPLINILPDHKDIEMKIERLLDERSSLTEKGALSRKFVEDHHSHVLVAQKYVNEWLV